MNIAYISADFGVPIFGYKGASVHVREMIAAWHKAGHTVCVISPAMEPATHEAFFPLPAAAHHLQMFNELERLDTFLGMKTRIRQELRNLLYNLTLYETALPYLQSRQVDCIYERYSLFSYAGIRLARACGVPHILEVNAPLAYEQEKTRGLEMKELACQTECRIMRETDAVIVVSRRLQEFVATCGVPESHIHILPNAVDPQRFATADNGVAVRTQLQLNGKRVIGFVGSLKPWHGTETLCKAFHALHAAVPHTHLLLIGDGPEREALWEYVISNNIKDAVTFTGNVSYNSIPNYISAMDITVAPYNPSENFYFSPIKIFEYMIMGKPIIAGRIGQVEEFIIDGETGVLFEPGNIAQLTAALTQLTTDVQLCHGLGARAQAWVQQERTWDNNARRVIDIAQALARKSASSSALTERVSS
jgi:glycosyltransferase involved in cell wall biosynthesis